MFNSSFLPYPNTYEAPKPNYPHPNFSNAINPIHNFTDDQDFELLDHLLMRQDQQPHEDSASSFTPEPPAPSSWKMPMAANHTQFDEIIERANMDVGRRIAFRTKTQLEIMDDGYKWRKYGKKKVKSGPNPRHYFKCSNGGCKVKKRIERDGEDSSYVITTYEGIHTHPRTCL